MSRLISALKNALFFVLVGPPIGVVLYWTWGWALTGDEDAAGWLGILWLLPLGYLLAGLPAAATGFVIGLLVEPRRPIAYLAASGLIGAILAGALALVDTSSPSSMDGVTNFAAIGGLAALATAGVRVLLHLRRGSGDGKTASSPVSD